MQVSIIEHTKNPLRVAYTAARTCYSDSVPSKIYREKPREALIKSVIEMGHHSVLEHIGITFGIEGISRACSHQLVRHRIASYSQQSQRYVKFEDGFDYVVPYSIKKDPELQGDVDYFIEDVKRFYQAMLERGIPAEDARYIIPNACCTNITMTVNARELIEMCKLRLCNKAQWEIRDMFNMLKDRVKSNKDLSFIADYLNPKCIWIGKCPEGKRSCGGFHQTTGEE